MKDITRVLGVMSNFLGAWVALWMTYAIMKFGWLVMSHIIGSLSATGLLIFLVALGWSVWQEVHK